MGVEDVMMLARRSEDLGRVLRTYQEGVERGKGGGNGRGGKKKGKR